MFFKTYIRTIIKYAAADVGAVAAASRFDRKKDNEKATSWLVRLETSIAGKVTADSSEAADIRMERYFPDKAYTGGINLEPGIYNAAVTFYSHGKAIAKNDFTEFNVRANVLNLIEAASLK
jgi:hypothetical protein